MQLSDSLEVAIGLSFMFFLTSLVLASVHEVIEMVAKARGAYLFNGVRELLGGLTPEQATATAQEVYTHPLIEGLMKGSVAQTGFFRRNLPSYIPTRSFALALLDKAARGDLNVVGVEPTPPSALSPVQQLRMTVEGIGNMQVREALIHAIETAGDEMDTVQANVEQWFDSAMDRVSGWYKRRSQRIIFTLGLATAFALNVNTVVVGQALAGSMSLRHALVDEIQQIGEACSKDSKCAQTMPANAVTELNQANLPVGWADTNWSKIESATGAGPLNFSGDSRGTSGRKVLGWIELLAGYCLTAFAVTLGAPFWFDVLNRLMVIRATVKPTEKSKDEASQDPQPTSGAGPTVVVTAAPAPAPDPAVMRATVTPLAIDTNIYANLPEAADRLFEDDFGEPVAGVMPPSIGGTSP